MFSRRTSVVMLALSLLAALSLLPVAARSKKRSEALGTMPTSERALHALNRLSFGPRPGEVQQVQQMGVERWIDLQLDPEKIDDSALQARLAPFRTLRMSTREIVENFPPPQVLKAIADGKLPMPSDPAKRAIYESALEKYKAQQQRKTEAADPQSASSTANGAVTPASANSDQMATPTEQQKRREARMYAELEAGEILDLPPDQRYAAIMKMAPERREMLARSLDPERRQQMLGDLSPQQRETLMALANPQQVVANELMQAKVLRAVYSERQLDEVMTDFWFNHFNVFVNKGPDHYMITAYERDVIRPRALGKFKDLLLATAQSPAMLFYLDNWQSVGPDSAVAEGLPARAPNRPAWRMDRYGRMHPAGRGQNRPQRPANQQKQARRGLNENYAREIMELHTLGVDGGYTQHDVTELAKILTGWTIAEPRRGGGYEFNQRMHEPGDKHWLGHTIHDDGENEGKKAIAILASNPATARFISRKLVMRFVSDDPPKALVERMAQTYLKTDGDIREVLRTLFSSPEFWSADDYRAKTKTPLEFVASALRATAANVSDAAPVVQSLNRMGMPLYGAQPPTGYSMKAETWVNSSALLNRMNFALALGNGKLRGVQIDQQILLGAQPPSDANAALSLLEGDLLNGDISMQTHQVIEKQLTDPQVTGRKLDDPGRPPNYGAIAGLLLGSPEFQKR
ncbi:MAG TPA: DUF1800 domain-containing protein [Terriglobales bacterium]|nr:DUF1800 domain-containing protein [Terriglobales bacterium]